MPRVPYTQPPNPPIFIYVAYGHSENGNNLWHVSEFEKTAAFTFTRDNPEAVLFGVRQYKAIERKDVIKMTCKERPSVQYKPRLFRDGDQWCALFGDDLQSGVVGFGESPATAMFAFDLAWNETIEMRATRLGDRDRLQEKQRIVDADKRNSIAERAAMRFLHGEYTGKESARLRMIIVEEIWHASEER